MIILIEVRIRTTSSALARKIYTLVCMQMELAPNQLVHSNSRFFPLLLQPGYNILSWLTKHMIANRIRLYDSEVCKKTKNKTTLRVYVFNASLLHGNLKPIKKLNIFYKFTNLKVLKACHHFLDTLLQLTSIWETYKIVK